MPKFTPAYATWIKTLENGEEKLKSIVNKIPLENRMTTPMKLHTLHYSHFKQVFSYNWTVFVL